MITFFIYASSLILDLCNTEGITVGVTEGVAELFARVVEVSCFGKSSVGIIVGRASNTRDVRFLPSFFAMVCGRALTYLIT